MKFFEIDEEYLKKGGLITRVVYDEGVSYGLNEGCLVRFYLGKIVKPIRKFIGYEEDLLASDWLYVRKEKWEPSYNEKYYYISATGYVLNDTFIPCVRSDTDKLNFNNVFKDEEDAKKMLEKLKIINILRKISNINFNDDCCVLKYVIYYDSVDNKVRITNHSCCRELPFDIYFKSEEDCQKAIDTIGEEYLKNTILTWSNNEKENVFICY